MSLLLGATLIYAPLTLASIGRRLWISFKARAQGRAWRRAPCARGHAAPVAAPPHVCSDGCGAVRGAHGPAPPPLPPPPRACAGDQQAADHIKHVAAVQAPDAGAAPAAALCA